MKKLFLLFLLPAVLLADNRLKDKTQATVPASDDYLYLDGATNGVRALKPWSIGRHGADVASAGTVDLDAATGDLIDVTGTTTITAITLSEGRSRVVRFTGALTLTHGSSLVLPGAASITTAAGDYAIFRGYASSVVRCVAYSKATGKSTVAPAVGDITGLGTTVATTLGNAINAASGMVVKNSDSTLTLAGALIRTPATITVTAGAGTIDVTKGYSQASVVATTTLTPSAAGTAGQFCVVDIICDSTQRVVTVDTATDFSVTCPPSLTTTILMRSDGSGWILVGGSPTLVDATADTAPATTKLIGTTDATTGVTKKTTIAQLQAVTDAAPGTLTNHTFDANGTSNVLKWIEEIQLTHPHMVDGTGATMGTTSTAATYGRAIYAGGTDKATNYAVYWITVPFDLDTATDLSANLVIRLGAADTGKQIYEISMADITDSASVDAPTYSNAVTLQFAGDASGASADRESVAYTTLTSWKSSLTAGHTLAIKVARDGDDGTNDTSTQTSVLMGLNIKVGHSQ